MSEKVNEAKVNENMNNENPTAEVEGTKLEGKVVNGKLVYEEKKSEKAGLGTTIKKGFIKLGMAIKNHPLATALFVGGAGLAGAGIKKAYENGKDHGYAQGYADKTKEIEEAEQRKLEEQELAKLEQENMDIPEIDTVVNENGEEVG